jgi:hypothetical protein
MTEYTGAWSPEAVADFLQTSTLPIRVSTRRPDGSLWPVALWYRYRDGVFECATEASADLVTILRNDPAVGIDVSTNDVPYRGVRGAGRATITREGAHSLLRELVQRYLGGTDSTLATRLLSKDRKEVRIRIEPLEIYSWDYADRMADVTRK